MTNRAVVVSLALVFLFAGSSAAGTIYFGVGSAATGDDAFQAAVAGAGAALSINDMEGLVSGSDVPSVLVGPNLVDVGLANGGPLVSTTAEVFHGSFAGGGGTATTVLGNSLLNRTSTGALTTDIVFDFAAPVFAAGIWAFDNSSGSVDRVRWAFTEVGGTTTPVILDANPGQGAHIVEGFVGMTSGLGITRLTMTSLDQNDLPQMVAFEVDNLQVGVTPLGPAATVPLPTAAWAGLFLIVLLAAVRRQRSRIA